MHDFDKKITENISDTSSDNNEVNEKLRDFEQEKIDKALEQIEVSEEAIDDPELEIVNKKKELTKKVKAKDLKKLTKSQTDKEREKLLKQALKYSNVYKETSHLKNAKRVIEQPPLVKRLKKLLENILAFKMHAIRAPGDQAGLFDKIKPKKSGLMHDFDFGPEHITKNFSTDLGTQNVQGQLFAEITDKDKDGIMEIAVTQINVSHADNVSLGNLGKISPEAIASSIKNDGGLIR